MAKIHYGFVAQAELKPDCYAGETCDGVEHLWDCFWDGDKDGGTITGPIVLDPTMYPPGTRVRIEAPCCPNCGVPADVKFGFQDGAMVPLGEVDDCQCGFDWHAWTLDQYS